ncbi:MAG: cytochrome-c peroxidase, partial [Anaerolineales bacterium]|nr:cytochrome-c peroxidase [Anaerolineales bacterium]
MKKLFVFGLLSVLVSILLSACGQNSANIDRRLAARLDQYGIGPLELPELASPEMIALGEMLFWDPELSGNRDTACATCHRPEFGTGDGLSLPAGTGSTGLGPARVLGGEREFVPRNASPLYNLGYSEWEVMFWDGRAEGNVEVGYESPAYDALPEGLQSVLAVQAMFPVTSRDEMLGDRGDVDIFGQKNELAWIKDIYPERIWAGLMLRLMAIPEYRQLFQAAYPGVPVDEMGFEYAANAIAAFETAAFTFIDSPWDRYLRGDREALSEAAKRG